MARRLTKPKKEPKKDRKVVLLELRFYCILLGVYHISMSPKKNPHR